MPEKTKMNLKFILGDTEENRWNCNRFCWYRAGHKRLGILVHDEKQDSEEDSAAVLQKTVGDGIDSGRIAREI